MIKIILITFGIVSCIDALFEKWFVWDWIEEQGSKAKSKFVFDLSFCRFCLLFHLGWMVTLFVACFEGFTWSCLLVPFVVSGIMYKMNKNGL